MGPSINDVLALGGSWRGYQGFCDSSTLALLLKNRNNGETECKKTVKNCATSFMDDPYERKREEFRVNVEESCGEVADGERARYKNNNHRINEERQRKLQKKQIWLLRGKKDKDRR
jgi:hypothetical protein